MEIKELINAIREAAYEVHLQLEPGYVEDVYKRALQIELLSRGIPVEREVPVSVYYKGHNVGDYRIDIFVDRKVVVEAKATSEPSKKHDIQLINYLATTGINDGLLINFGTKVFLCHHKTKDYVKR